MTRFYNLLFCTVLSVTLFSCGNNSSSKKDNFSISITDKDGKFQKGEPLQVAIQAKNNASIDSISYFYNNTLLTSTQGNKQIPLSLTAPLGKNTFSATIYSDGKKYTASKEIILHNNVAPKLYTYKIVNTYPHDPTAFTQGLEFHNDTLYEGTGRHGMSHLRKVDFKTGKVLKDITLPQTYFGEGISVMNDKIYQLTWQSGDGFVYDAHTFKKLKTFSYNQSKEGWGLCNNGKKLYKSDGTEKIWILNPETLEEESYIQTVTQNALATRLNELEWVKGKIYANTWQKDGIAIIDPTTGAIEGLIDFRGLRNQVTQAPNLDVLNGIAYNPTTDKLYVTGKNWDKLFEIEIMEK